MQIGDYIFEYVTTYHCDKGYKYEEYEVSFNNTTIRYAKYYEEAGYTWWGHYNMNLNSEYSDILEDLYKKYHRIKKLERCT